MMVANNSKPFWFWHKFKEEFPEKWAELSADDKTIMAQILEFEDLLNRSQPTSAGWTAYTGEPETLPPESVPVVLLSGKDVMLATLSFDEVEDAVLMPYWHVSFEHGEFFEVEPGDFWIYLPTTFETGEET